MAKNSACEFFPYSLSDDANQYETGDNADDALAALPASHSGVRILATSPCVMGNQFYGGFGVPLAAVARWSKRGHSQILKGRSRLRPDGKGHKDADKLSKKR
jgi:hypothetical protein